MPEVEIKFSPEQVATGSFRLLELPPDLCKLIESSADDLRYACIDMVYATRLFLIYAPD
jgi:hypothetical protein